MIGEMIIAKIVDIIDENYYIKSFFLKPKRKMQPPRPGQFYMVWVPGYEEIPISVSGYFSGIVRLTIANVGETTNALHTEFEIGDYLGLKGPLGTSLPIEESKRYLLIGGGYGIAPLMFAARELSRRGIEVVLAEGAKTVKNLIFIEEATQIGLKLIIATEDGSFGFKGTIFNVVKEKVNLKSFDIVAVCGPKGMLDSFSRLIHEEGINGYIFAESYMKCGIGACGSCVLGKSGLLVCKDGPVFDNKTYFKAIFQ